jgi:CDP-diacylglycerol--serine O-phosphatidyltransferase
MRRAAPALPNGLTLGNLFFGIFAIISASRGQFDRAVLFIVLGGVCDAFDGQVARATRTGGRFGEELDSLVDAVSFGLAPAMIVYFSVLSQDRLGPYAVFLFAACAVLRLARFNVTQAGESKSFFIGLPSPAAGGTLATYYWFSQTSLYQQTAIVDLPWQEIMIWLMVVLAFLMVSNVPYPAWPKVGLRSWRAVLGLVLVLAIVLAAAYFRRSFFFPFGVAYVGYGLLRALLLGMWERRPGGDAYAPDDLEPEFAGAGAVGALRGTSGGYPLTALHDDDVDADEAVTAAPAENPAPRRRRRRRGRGGSHPPASRPLDGPNE